ncbi:Conidiation protein 6-domain-containing protein [Suillus clintonianus]|uniref:Conidiation protein 6-domain-containing protein n=1 Tax=Suillus clintonianus TaxID=1904413 RepID=UPI001B87A39B|nr:Conidiation protein 6-domain-containing protein [Suillus clintonianus]KAG2153804.1 Conidiation protein 6-domain-containing protein [Suillus clintonianus]
MSGTKEHTKDTARVVAGLKAAVHNPNVSDEAKDNALKRLEEMGQSADPITPAQAKATQTAAAEAHEKNVLRGYKAATSNPNVSEEAKQHAREVLEAAGIQHKLDTHSDEEHQHRVLAGYKAAIHNPNVSAAAKQHAREYLADSGFTDVI